MGDPSQRRRGAGPCQVLDQTPRVTGRRQEAPSLRPGIRDCEDLPLALVALQRVRPRSSITKFSEALRNGDMQVVGPTAIAGVFKDWIGTSQSAVAQSA